MTDIFTLSLKDITPHNIAEDENVASLITAIDPQLQEISRNSLEPLIMARIDELPEKVLDLLAWQLHTDFYDLAGTLAMKQEAVKSSILWHMHKGTEWAIQEALRQIDIAAVFVPWWETGDEPYTFRLTAIVAGDFYRTTGRDKLQSSIRRAIEESKAARSMLSDLRVEIKFSETVQFFAGTITLENRDVEIGADSELMQQLLQLFEQRILNRIDEYERNITLKLETQQREINLQLSEIKSMLQWKGADEPL